MHCVRTVWHHKKSLKYVLDGTLLVKLKIPKTPFYLPYTYKNFKNITFLISFTALFPTLTECYQTHEQYLSKEKKYALSWHKLLKCILKFVITPSYQKSTSWYDFWGTLTVKIKIKYVIPPSAHEKS